jgi:hypothetical protein
MPAKRIVLDGVVMQAVELLGRDLGKDFVELGDEAFRDLLKKHRRPVGLRDALRQSLDQSAGKGSVRRSPASPSGVGANRQRRKTG